MRISDWSSDVCSSDLSNGAGPGEQPPEDASYRIRREGSGPLGAMGRAWRGGKWLRRFSYLCLAGLVGLAGIWIVITRDLPDARKLLEYQPPLPTMVRGIDGAIVYSYVRERRVPLRFVDFLRPARKSVGVGKCW